MANDMTDSNSTNPGRANESLSADDLAFHLVPAAEQDTECIGKLLQAIQAWSTPSPTAQSETAFAKLCLTAASGPKTPTPSSKETTIQTKTPSSAAVVVVCMLNSDPGVILGVLAAVSTVDYLLSEEFSAEREAYKDACRQEGIEPINLGHPPAGVIPRPAAVPWDTISALGGSTVSLIQTDPTSGPEVFDSLIRGLRAHQDSFPEEERPGYTFPLHGEDLDRFYQSALENGISEVAHLPTRPTTAPDTAHANFAEQAGPSTIYMRLRPVDHGVRSLRHFGVGEQRYEAIKRLTELFQERLQIQKAMSSLREGDEEYKKYAIAAKETLERQQELYRSVDYVPRRDLDGMTPARLPWTDVGDERCLIPR